MNRIQNSATAKVASRRRFLSQSLAAAAALGFVRPSSLAASQRPLSNMQLGLVTYLWGKDMNLTELIDVCEQSQVLGVELRTEHKHGVEPTLSSAEREEVRKRFENSPVELVGYGSNCEFHAADRSELAANIKQAKEYIRLMHDCGGTGVKVKPNGFAKDVARQKTIEQIGKSLNEVAAYGEGYGQKIRVEVHGRGTSSLEVMREIFEVADHPNVYVCWNSNAEDLAGDGLQANFEMVRNRLGDTIHVREFDVGDYPYPQLIELLKGIDYSGWVLLEARTDPKDKLAALIKQREIFEGWMR